MTFDERDLIFTKSDIEFGSFEDSLSIERSLNYSIKSLGDDSIFAHVYLMRSGHHPDPLRSKFDQTSTVYKRINLVGKMPKPRHTSNLLNPELAKPQSDLDSKEVNYWYPEVRISLVQDNSPLQPSGMPFSMRKQILGTVDGRRYLPILYTNEFWQLKDKRIVIEGDRLEYPLSIIFSPMSMFKFQLLTNFDQSLQMNEQLFGGDGETEKLKQMFIDTNPYLLMITLFVSLLHSIFDFLAFKNGLKLFPLTNYNFIDIQFWRQKDNLQGLSVRSVLVNAVFQVIIFLYLLDQETSWLILVSMAIGTAIELWKITRVLSVRVYFNGFLPRIEIKDRASYAKSLTQKYDELAMKYLGAVATPLLIGYCVYSLIYEEHKGWYSWILGTLVGFVYTFGFITMTPQLFINYKLKSVAHIPWRVFIYKSLNTFIDDLFAFIIKMPTLHRLACFRDDVVFVIYLYQRWIYPVDRSRPNEYGQVFEKVEEKGEEEEKEKEEGKGKEEEEKVMPDKGQKEQKSTRRQSLRARNPPVSAN